MKPIHIRIASLVSAALLLGLGCVSPAQADWSFTQSGTKGSGTYNSNDYLANTTYSGSPSLTISGLYAANGTGNGGFATNSSWVSNANSALTIYGGGIAMASDGDDVPNHALDNNGNTEAVLMQFGSSVVLNSLSLGYVSGDADVSVFRYVGTGTPTLGSTSTFASDAASLGSGWDLVGNYNGSSAYPQAIAVNSTNLGSSWWLVSAYNTAFGGNLSEGNDYFKIASVAGVKCTAGGTQCGGTSTGGGGGSAPEPGSLALVCAALAGTWIARRRFSGVVNAAAA